MCAVMEGGGSSIELTFVKRLLSASCFLLPLSHFREGKIEAWGSWVMYWRKWWSKKVLLGAWTPRPGLLALCPIIWISKSTWAETGLPVWIKGKGGDLDLQGKGTPNDNCQKSVQSWGRGCRGGSCAYHRGLYGRLNSLLNFWITVLLFVFL